MTADFAFLHGGGQGSWVWAETVAAMERQTGGAYGRVLLLDAPGCGTKRARDTDGLGLEDVARELIADVEAAGMRDVVLVGHSQGGQAMALMAATRPDLFRRLVHISCSIPLPGQTVLQLIGKDVHGSHPDEVGWPVDPSSGPVAERYGAMFCNDMAAEGATAFLGKLGQDGWPRLTYAFTDWPLDGLKAVPATYVACLRDGILPMAWQERFAERFGADRIVRVDAGHQVMVTRPEALAEILLEVGREGSRS